MAPAATASGRAGVRRAVGVAVAGVAVLVAVAGIGQFVGGEGGDPAGNVPGSRAAPTADAPSGRDAAGRPVPGHMFERFDGTAATLSDYRGRPLVVNFWASWCPPCVAEMPDFEAVHQQLGDQVAFLGVNLTDDPAAGDALARRTGVTYDLARDPNGQLFEAMGGFSMPTTFLVSAEGRIVEQRNGQLSRSQLERLVDEKLLG